MVAKAKNEEVPAEDKAEVLEEVKTAVDNLKVSRTEKIRLELEDLGNTRGERVKSFNVSDNGLVNAVFEDADGKEVRHYSRKLED